ncbi:TetR family transcriptional regulator [Streptomyces sp. BE20]|uniref:TetR family transcriptional regulator n=1 Tax=Streptomycetaceae TaxID=2062 RepID=UPI002E77755D|nr:MULTISPECIES: TetR family transcriptional regulator [unclassified Streptomyces]MED7953475.1 TetR family transcriptional regulator [Streptomyces sp. BE303]MEE1823058.1 TetR family transcriptional regulator [Streptomyces sp. BE20]
MGLREDKKHRTRALLADTAMGLFAERGFEQVTVVEVARAAGVSPNTVFNYFPTKEDLFFDRQDEVEGHLARVVRERPAGASVVDAVRTDLLAGLDAGEPTYGLSPQAAVFWRLVAESPALRARLLDLGERAERALAAALAEEAGTPADAPLPRLVAGAIAGAHRAVFAEIRRGMVAGEPVDAVRTRVEAAVTAGFGLLGSGLAGWPPAR